MQRAQRKAGAAGHQPVNLRHPKSDASGDPDLVLPCIELRLCQLSGTVDPGRFPRPGGGRGNRHELRV